MKILITGSEGNIGKKLVPYLKKCSHEIMRCDQIQKFEENYEVVNILFPGDLFQVFYKFKPDIVFHLAAMVSRMTCEKSPYLTVDTNISGLNNVIQLCKQFDSKLIYISTSEVYGNIGGELSEDRECEPNNLYGLTKYLGEKLVIYELHNGLRSIIVRPFMIYDEDETQGDHRSAMIRFCFHLKRGEKIDVHKKSIRSWMHISDAIRILERIIYINDFEIINIGSDELYNTEELAEIICRKLGVNYYKFVNEIELPDKMTLKKIPNIKKQFELTGIIPEINLDYGIDLVLKNNVNSYYSHRCKN